MNNCIFCKIINGEISSEKVFENDKVLAFKDIQPQAPIHFILVHKVHTKSLSSTEPNQDFIYSDIFNAIKQISEQYKLNQQGFRVIINDGKAAGQTVFHLHAHILGGKDDLGPMLTEKTSNNGEYTQNQALSQ